MIRLHDQIDGLEDIIDPLMVELKTADVIMQDLR
jgi:hypothetical protein